MEEFIDQLYVELKDAVRKDMNSLLEMLKEEKIYGASLVLDEDCVSMYFVVNTYEAMKRQDEKYCDMMKGFYSEEQIEDVKKGKKSFIKWTSAEWEYALVRDSALTKISEMMINKEEENPVLYAKYKTQLIDNIIAAYKMIIMDGILEANSDSIIYLVSMADSEMSSELELYSVRELNSKEKYEAFLERADESGLFFA